MVAKVYGQTIDSAILKQVLDSNAKILGLNDSSLIHETTKIRVFNFSGKPFNEKLLEAISVIDDLNVVDYNMIFSVYLVQNKKITTDINSGRYRDIFIQRVEATGKNTLKVITLAFRFKATNCIYHDKFMGEFEFVKNKDLYILTKSTISGMD